MPAHENPLIHFAKIAVNAFTPGHSHARSKKFTQVDPDITRDLLEKNLLAMAKGAPLFAEALLAESKKLTSAGYTTLSADEIRDVVEPLSRRKDIGIPPDCDVQKLETYLRFFQEMQQSNDPFVVQFASTTLDAAAEMQAAMMVAVRGKPQEMVQKSAENTKPVNIPDTFNHDKFPIAKMIATPAKIEIFYQTLQKNIAPEINPKTGQPYGLMKYSPFLSHCEYEVDTSKMRISFSALQPLDKGQIQQDLQKLKIGDVTMVSNKMSKSQEARVQKGPQQDWFHATAEVKVQPFALSFFLQQYNQGVDPSPKNAGQKATPSAIKK